MVRDIQTPRTFGMKMNGHGLGIGPTGTSIRLGSLRRLNARLSAARSDVPVLSISGDGGFLFTSNELATAMRHRIALTTVVFNDGAFGNVRRIQEENYGNRLIASDLANPDFVKFAESFGAAAERVRSPEELRGALKRGFARRDGPTLIEMPVGPMPSPWEFILMGKVRG